MRRRIQAVPIPGASSSFAIGVTMTPLAAQPAQSSGGGNATEILGPFVFNGAAGTVALPPELTATCGWTVLITGVSSADVITWELETSYDESFPSPAYGAVMAPGVLSVVATNYGTLWIKVTATVNGDVYSVYIGQEPGTEGNAACAF